MRLRIPEERHDFVGDNGGNRSAHSRDCGDGQVLEIPCDLAQVFGIEVEGEPRRAHELARQRGELSSLRFGRLGSELPCVGTLRSRHELVPNSWHGYDNSRNLRIPLDLAPESSNKHIDAAIEGIRVTTCNSAAQLVPR